MEQQFQLLVMQNIHLKLILLDIQKLKKELISTVRLVRHLVEQPLINLEVQPQMQTL